MRITVRIILALVMVASLDITSSLAATMNDYCIIPPFIQEIAKPNLLMLIDNSASMYDLAYVDRGKKHCSTSTTRSCFSNTDCNHCSATTAQGCATTTDCPTSETCVVTNETCSVFEREPFYCFDETYNSATSYVGYFNNKDANGNDVYYYYRPATDDFAMAPPPSPAPATFPFGCGVANTNFTIAGTMCLEYIPSTFSIVNFVAKGNYLNWLTSSKFDVEKKVLTGGKYVGTSLIPESRGCVGQGYLKQPLSSDFTNYASTMVNFVPTPADPNIASKLPLIFTVRGPLNQYNASSPSAGGQTYIDLFGDGTKVYNSSDCQGAIQALATGGNADIKKTVAACLKSTEAQYCALKPTLACAFSHTAEGSPNCDQIMANVCSGDLTRSFIAAPCTPGDDTTCTSSNGKVCSGNNSKSCVADTDCKKIETFYCNYGSPTRMACTGTASTACYITNNSSKCVDRAGHQTNTNCDASHSCSAGQLCLPQGNYNCISALDNYDYGTCTVGTAPVQYGSCLASNTAYVGPCLFDGGATKETKAKVAFQQSMQACWQMRNGIPIGIDEVRTADNQCTSVYASYFTCSNNHELVCGINSDCGAGNTCMSGPEAIVPGNPALLCGSTYVGQYYEQNGSGVWVRKAAATDAQIEAAHTQFCNDTLVPNVTDPTDSPSDTATADNLPAIISGVGVESQMGAPIKSMRVQIAAPSPPSGLVQEYANKIRIGVMEFNTLGSASETSNTVPLPAGKLTPTKVCSNDLNKTCKRPEDCGGTNTCDNAADKDGAFISDSTLIGKGRCSVTTSTICTKAAHCPAGEECVPGYCSTTTTTPCKKDSNCPSGQTCLLGGVGNHLTGLIQHVDGLRAATWTPFSEAFYNAIGYFAIDPSDSTGKSSRTGLLTGLRLNATDFPDQMNPSEYACQANNILLITDGGSTADQNPDKASLVDVYKAVSGNVTGTCPKYAGSQDLDDLAWLARHRDINTFSKTAASTTVPAKKNQYITSYVVFTGADNGEADDCKNTTLLTKTANNGGTDLLKTDIPSQYETALRRAFAAVAGGTASGTAASILSNSEGSGANILQAVFYPSKEFETASGQLNPSSTTWIGEMQNLWYYVDPYIGNSSVREDTNKDKELHLQNDYVTEFQFKGGDTIAVLKKDSNGDGTGDTIVTTAMDPRVKSQGYCSITSSTKCATDSGCPFGETCNIQGIVSADDVNSLWRAGNKLWDRDLSTNPRKLYTYLYGSTASGCGGGGFSVAGLYDLAAIDWAAIGANDKCIIKSFLQASSDAEAQNIISFAKGYDSPDTGLIGGVAPRNRTVSIARKNADGTKQTDALGKVISDSHVWKLGDIISSTPRIQSFNKLNNYHVDSPGGYGDLTYADNDVTSFCVNTSTNVSTGVSCNAGGDCQTGEKCSGGKGFANSSDYKARGMAYAGANDGMLHAFKLGSLSVKTSGLTKAKLAGGATLGDEQWAFIPKNVLPYLKYLSDPDYSHLYLVDGPTRLLDASIGYNDNSYISSSVYSAAGCDATGSGSHTAYWACKEDPATDNNKSWRSILIGSMGIGGATSATCKNPDNTDRVDCVKSPIPEVGKSSYFALDITNPNAPQYLWEFSDPALGYATTGAGVARVSHQFDAGGVTYKDTNGRWFAVVGSGPTGSIDTTYHQFKGKSDNPLSVFVLDLKNGNLLRKFDTTITSAFAGSMTSAPIDTDRSRKLDPGFYSDDALYFGYSNCTSNCGTDTPVWNGGIMRLLTDEKITPADWSLSTLISNVGPVSTAIGKLQDRKFKNLWLYTGTGRYFFKGDDSTSPGRILAVKEPCYSNVNDDIYPITSINNATSPGYHCTNSITFAESSFNNQTDTINNVDSTKKGWFINLAGADNTNNFGAERVITEPVPMPNGAVFFTSFMPSTDICNYGGKSFMWGMRYDTGGTASADQLKGKALVQVSTGSFEEVNLSTALTGHEGRKMDTPMTGKPPTDPPPIVSASGNKPLKRILHIQEK